MKEGSVVNGARRHAVTALRRRVAAIEHHPPKYDLRPASHGVPSQTRILTPILSVGVPGIDERLPVDSLTRAGLHEILSGHGTGAALAFTAVLAARRAALHQAGRVLWCLSAHGPYGPGLAAYGLGAEQLILVRGRDDRQRLWAIEEALRCAGLAVVVGEVGHLDLGQSRRLQLAAEASGVTALLLHTRNGAAQGVSAARTRWRITPQPSAPAHGYIGIGAPRCRVELLHCKAGRPGEWLLQWNGATFEDHGVEDQRNGEPRKSEWKTDLVPVATVLADGPAVACPTGWSEYAYGGAG